MGIHNQQNLLAFINDITHNWLTFVGVILVIIGVILQILGFIFNNEKLERVGVLLAVVPIVIFLLIFTLTISNPASLGL